MGKYSAGKSPNRQMLNLRKVGLLGEEGPEAALSIGYNNINSKKCFNKIINIIFATIALPATDSLTDEGQGQHLYKFCL